MANFQVRLDYQFNDEVQYNVTYWQLPDGAQPTLQGLVDSIRASFQGDLVTRLSTNWSFRSCTFRQMDGGGAFTVTIPPSAGALVGGNNGIVAPTQTCLLVSTIFVGPKPNRGRIYFGGLAAQNLTPEGDWTVATLEDVGDMVTDWAINGLDTPAGDAFLRIARPSFTTNTWLLNNPIEAVVAQSNPATQQRRRKGTGI